MHALLYFLLGAIVCKYIFQLLDILYDWFVSYVSYKISILNIKIDVLANEYDDNNSQSTQQIGFVLPDNEDVYEDWDDEIDKK